MCQEAAQPAMIVLELLRAAVKGGWMPKVSTKHVQRRIAELDAQYTVAQPKRPGLMP